MADKTEQQDPQAQQQAEHAFLLADIERAMKRAAQSKYLEAQKEFSTECYPLMQTGFEHFGERLARLEAAMDALIDQTDSIIQPELADQIMATLDVGKVVANEVNKLKVGQTLDETTLKRLKGQAAAFLTAYEMTAEAIEDHVGGEPEDGETSDGEDMTDESDGETVEENPE